MNEAGTFINLYLTFESWAKAALSLLFLRSKF